MVMSVGRSPSGSFGVQHESPRLLDTTEVVVDGPLDDAAIAALRRDVDVRDRVVAVHVDGADALVVGGQLGVRAGLRAAERSLAGRAAGLGVAVALGLGLRDADVARVRL